MPRPLLAAVCFAFSLGTCTAVRETFIPRQISFAAKRCTQFSSLQQWFALQYTCWQNPRSLGMCTSSASHAATGVFSCVRRLIAQAAVATPKLNILFRQPQDYRGRHTFHRAKAAELSHHRPLRCENQYTTGPARPTNSPPSLTVLTAQPFIQINCERRLRHGRWQSRKFSPAHPDSYTLKKPPSVGFVVASVDAYDTVVTYMSFALSSQAPKVFKGALLDGPTLHAVFYFTLKEDTAKALQDLDSAEPSVRLLAEYFRLVVCSGFHFFS